MEDMKVHFTTGNYITQVLPSDPFGGLSDPFRGENVTSTWGNKRSRMEEAGLLHLLALDYYMGVSKNNGTTKSSILIGFPLNHPFWGYPFFLETPIFVSITRLFHSLQLRFSVLWIFLAAKTIRIC